jgi:AraC-like DNA-binding protein
MSSTAVQNNAAKLLKAYERTSGLRLAYQDRTGRHCVPTSWEGHQTPCCCAVKARHLKTCMAFDRAQTHEQIAAMPAGRVQTCPFGFTELAVPVWVDGSFEGVLFAGQAWRRKSKAPAGVAVTRPSRQWLADRLMLLRATARELAALMRSSDRTGVPNRRTLIMAYLQANAHRPIRLADVARELHLSPSRTRHVIQDIFGMGLAALVRQMKLRKAAYELRASQRPIGQIAAELGYDDPAYFSRVFRQEFGCSPSQCRRRRDFMV